MHWKKLTGAMVASVVPGNFKEDKQMEILIFLLGAACGVFGVFIWAVHKSKND